MQLIPKHQYGNIILPHKVNTYDRNDARSYWNANSSNIKAAVHNEQTQGHQIRHGDFYYNSKTNAKTGSAPQGLIQESPEFDIIGLGRAVVTSLGKGIVGNAIKRQVGSDMRYVPERIPYTPDKLAGDRQSVIDFFKSPEYNTRFESALKTPGSKLNIYDRFDVQRAAQNNVTNARVVRVPDLVLDRDGAIASSSTDGIINIPEVRQIPNNTMIHELGHQSALNGSELPPAVRDWNNSLIPTPKASLSNSLEHTSDLNYLSDPDELRAKAIDTMVWARKSGIKPSDLPNIPKSNLPMDAGHLFGAFDQNSVINYLNKFLMLTGAAGIANKKGEP